MTLHLPAPAQLRLVGHTFETREEAEGTNISSGFDHITVGGLQFKRHTNGTALTDSGGNNWAPFLWNTVLHYAENTNPGVTPMHAAAQAAIDWAIFTQNFVLADRQHAPQVVWPGNQSYLHTAKVSFAPEQGIHLVGNGAMITTTLEDYLFRIGHDDFFDEADVNGSGVAAYGGSVRGFVFTNTNATAVGSGAFEIGSAWEMQIEGNTFRDFDLTLDAVTTGRLLINKNVFRLRQRTTVNSTAFLRVRSHYDSTVDTSLTTGMRLTNNEMDGVSGSPLSRRDLLQAAVLIHSTDSFYSSDNHIRFCKTHFKLEPLGSANNYRDNTIFDVFLGPVTYCDGPGTGPNVHIAGTIAYDTVVGNEDRSQGYIGQIHTASNTKFRGGSNAAHGFLMETTDSSSGGAGTYVAARGLPDVGIAGEFTQHEDSHIESLGGGSIIPWHVNVHDVRVEQSNAAGALGDSGSIVRQISGRLTVDGVSVIGEENNAPTYLFSYNGSGGEGQDWGVYITNVDARVSTYSGTSPFFFANMVGVGYATHGIIEKGDFSQASQRKYSAKLTGAGPLVGMTFTLPAVSPGAAGASMTHTAVCDSVTGADDIYGRIVEDVFARRKTGTTTVAVRSNVSTNLSAGWSTNAYPASLVPLFGTAWASSTAYSVGDVVTNGGNTYLCVKSAGSSAGSGGPSGTSGLITDGSITWVYCGVTTANTFVVVLSGEAGTDLRFAGEVDSIGL